MRQLSRRFRQKFGLRFSPREDHTCRQLARHYDINGRFKRIYHYHIRKTGGTSINQILLASSGNLGREVYAALARSSNARIIVGDKVFVGWNRHLIEQGSYYFAFSHIPAHQITIPDQTFTITCVRDPLRRLISHYSMLMDYKAEGVFRSDLKEEMNWLGNDFADFVANMPREQLLRQIYMFSPKFDVAEAFAKIANCSFILFTKTLAEDVDDLSKQLDLDLKPVHERRSSKRYVIEQAGIDLAQTALEPELRLVAALEKHKLALRKGQR